MANLRVDKITSTETFEKTGSVQFDGTGDYLDVSDSSDWDFGTGPFTIECWVLMDPSTVGYSGIFGMHTGSVQFQFRINNVGTIQFLQDFGGTRGNIDDSDATGVNLRDSTWHHVVMVRQSDYSWQLYVDGKVNYSGTGMTGNVTSINEVAIGRRTDTNDYYLTGNISNLRVLNTALYTSNFKPPMRELEVTAETVLLACQSKTDATLEKTGKTITANGNAVASELTPGLLTPIVKSGGGSAITGSVEFTGSPSKLTADSVDFAMGSNDLTMECWFYNGVDTITHVLQIDTGTYQSPSDITNFSLATRDAAAGDVRFLIRNDSGSNLSDLISGAPGAKINAWHHLAGTIEGTTTRLFLNGILIASGTISGTRTHTGQHLTIGANQTSRYLKGYMSNVRIVKGTALYTDSFTPPTRELKRVPGTVLLCCQDPDNPFTEATGKTLGGGGNFQRSNGIEYITNGSFIGGYTTEWEAKNSANLSHSNGQLTVTSTQNYSGVKVKSAYLPTLTVGRKYAMTVDIVSLTNPIRFGVVSGNTLSDISIAGRHTLIFTGTASTTEIFIEKATGSNSTFVLNSVSLKEIDGLHPSSNFTPQIGDDRKVTFEGVTKINTDAYFYLPTGDTASRETTGTYNAGARGLFTGGYDQPALTDTIDYITISSTGNALDFGNLTDARLLPGALASSVRGIIGGGTDPSASNIIDYVTIPSTGNANDFGDLTVARRAMASFSNNVRGIWAGGDNPSRQTTIDYVTISSTGNAATFGTLGEATNTLHGTSSPTRGLLMGGETGSVSPHNAISYVTISTTGSNKDFGDLTQARRGCSSCSSPIRALTGGGNTGSVTNTIDFVTIATTGNAFDFGDLTQARWLTAATSNSIRGVWGGGYNPSPAAEYDIIDYIAIASTGNATDFGNLQTSKRSPGACSNGHGGLG